MRTARRVLIDCIFKILRLTGVTNKVGGGVVRGIYNLGRGKPEPFMVLRDMQKGTEIIKFTILEIPWRLNFYGGRNIGFFPNLLQHKPPALKDHLSI